MYNHTAVHEYSLQYVWKLNAINDKCMSLKLINQQGCTSNQVSLPLQWLRTNSQIQISRDKSYVTSLVLWTRAVVYTICSKL